MILVFQKVNVSFTNIYMHLTAVVMRTRLALFGVIGDLVIGREYRWIMVIGIESIGLDWIPDGPELIGFDTIEWDWYRLAVTGYPDGRILGNWIGWSSFKCCTLVD